MAAERAPDPSSDGDGLVLYSSLRGLGSAVFSPAVLIALGAAGLQGGWRWFPGLLLAGGLVLAAGLLLDFPRHTRFGTEGMERVCPLRRQHIPWSETVAIERAPASTTDRLRSLREDDKRPIPSGGLVATGTGRRRWLLTDRAESTMEYEALTALLARQQTATVLRAGRPRAENAPTSLYRRRR